MPYVAMKYAMTLDGKIASCTGDSKWVTGEKARHHVHELRKQYSAILAGIGTVLADDPMLNCRIEGGVDPVRVVCDSSLRIPLSSQLVKTAGDIPVIVAYAKENPEKEKALLQAGVELISAGRDGRVNLAVLMRELGKRKIDSVLVEGGGAIHGSLLKSGLVQKIFCYLAPKLIGGREAGSPVEGDGFSRMKDALPVKEMEILPLGEDICISGRVEM